MDIWQFELAGECGRWVVQTNNKTDIRVFDTRAEAIVALVDLLPPSMRRELAEAITTTKRKAVTEEMALNAFELARAELQLADKKLQQLQCQIKAMIGDSDDA